MKLTVNGEELDYSGVPELPALIVAQGADLQRTAAAVNGAVVPKADWPNCSLKDGDVIELLVFAGGGSGPDPDLLQLGDMRFESRLILGTGKFANTAVMVAAIKASDTELVTVALRRFNPAAAEDDLYGPLAEIEGLTLMPNTSGAMNAREALRAAELGRELSGSRLVKLEIHPNPHHLLPDPIETLAAARALVDEGFLVMPYIAADPVLAKRLEDAGCVSVMPLGAPIGSGEGLSTRDMLRIIVRDSNIPVIVDAGLRAPSEAAAAMEMGCSAVLVNSAVAVAEEPVAMAAAFAATVQAGRAAYRAGLMPRSGGAAIASSPLTSFLDED
jgi:thiazole synthase